MQYSAVSVVIFTGMNVYCFMVQLMEALKGRDHQKHLTSVHSKAVLQRSPKQSGVDGDSRYGEDFSALRRM